MAINSQNAAFFRTALTPDAILVDEDGHVGLPANVWALRLTSMSKKLAISNLMVGDLADSGAWAACNYTLDDTTSQGDANQIQWSVNGRATTPH